MKVGSLIFSFFVAVFSLAALIMCKLFQYSFACVFGRDIPWYGDLAGGLVLNGFNLPIAVVCWILTLAGYSTPFLG
jgi:hypothetical protein